MLSRRVACQSLFVEVRCHRQTETSDCDPTSYRVNISMFGRRKNRERKHLWDMETSCYYGLIKSSSILCKVSMSREYDSDSMKHTNVWLETVTVA